MIPCWSLSRHIPFNTVNQSCNPRWQVHSLHADTSSFSAPSAGRPLQHPWNFGTLQTTESTQQSPIQTSNARTRRRRRRRPFRHGTAQKKNSFSHTNSRPNLRSSLFYFYYISTQPIFYFVIKYSHNCLNSSTNLKKLWSWWAESDKWNMCSGQLDSPSKPQISAQPTHNIAHESSEIMETKEQMASKNSIWTIWMNILKS